MKFKSIIFTILIIVVCFVGALVWGGLFTTGGARMITSNILKRWGGYADVSFGGIAGNMIEGLHVTDLKLSNIKKLPAGSVLEIKSLFIDATSFAINGATVAVENARLTFPISDPIFFWGRMEGGVLNFNVYSHNINVEEILRIFPENKTLKHVRGFLTDVDINLTGAYRQPVASGHFNVDKVWYKLISVSQAPGTLNLSLGREDGRIKIAGPVFFAKGEIARKKINVNLEKSKVVFTGSPKTPMLYLRGYSVVNDVKINIKITGSRDQPKMELSSMPALPETKLLIMLVTGRGWVGLDESIAQGSISPALAKDALDYFIFGGSGSGIAKRLGIRDVSIIYDQGKRGISIKEGLTDQIELGYGIEEEEDDVQNQSIVTQTLGGEIKMTDKISVGVERELKRNYDPATSTQLPISSESDDKLMLKYKRKF